MFERDSLKFASNACILYNSQLTDGYKQFKKNLFYTNLPTGPLSKSTYCPLMMKCGERLETLGARKLRNLSSLV